MKILLENVDENRDQWLDLKRLRVGSSEIATVCLMNEWQTPFELWAEKLGKIPPRPVTDDMWLGTQLEPVIGGLFARRTRLPVKPAKCLIQHESADFALASPDFWVDIGGALTILEAKSAKGRNWKFWEDGPPKGYILQLNWQLGIAKLECGFLARIIGADPENYRHHEFSLSSELFDFCMERAAEFDKCLREDIPPLAGPGDSKLIAELQGAREKTRVILGEKAVNDANAWEAIANEIAGIKNLLERKKGQLDKHKGRVLQLLGNAEEGILPDGRIVSAVTRTRKGYAMPAAKWVEFDIEKGD